MKLPYLESASVPSQKLTHYLLSPTHEEGAAKASFFKSFGYVQAHWEKLAEALVKHGGGSWYRGGRGHALRHSVYRRGAVFRARRSTPELTGDLVSRVGSVHPGRENAGRRLGICPSSPATGQTGGGASASLGVGLIARSISSAARTAPASLPRLELASVPFAAALQ
jgi:hypothetical protein